MTIITKVMFVPFDNSSTNSSENSLKKSAANGSWPIAKGALPTDEPDSVSRYLHVRATPAEQAGLWQLREIREGAHGEIHAKVTVFAPGMREHGWQMAVHRAFASDRISECGTCLMAQAPKAKTGVDAVVQAPLTIMPSDLENANWIFEPVVVGQVHAYRIMLDRPMHNAGEHKTVDLDRWVVSPTQPEAHARDKQSAFLSLKPPSDNDAGFWGLVPVWVDEPCQADNVTDDVFEIVTTLIDEFNARSIMGYKPGGLLGGDAGAAPDTLLQALHRLGINRAGMVNLDHSVDDRTRYLAALKQSGLRTVAQRWDGPAAPPLLLDMPEAFDATDQQNILSYLSRHEDFTTSYGNIQNGRKKIPNDVGFFDLMKDEKGKWILKDRTVKTPEQVTKQITKQENKQKTEFKKTPEYTSHVIIYCDEGERYLLTNQPVSNYSTVLQERLSASLLHDAKPFADYLWHQLAPVVTEDKQAFKDLLSVFRGGKSPARLLYFLKGLAHLLADKQDISDNPFVYQVQSLAALCDRFNIDSGAAVANGVLSQLSARIGDRQLQIKQIQALVDLQINRLDAAAGFFKALVGPKNYPNVSDFITQCLAPEPYQGLSEPAAFRAFFLSAKQHGITFDTDIERRLGANNIDLLKGLQALGCHTQLFDKFRQTLADLFAIGFSDIREGAQRSVAISAGLLVVTPKVIADALLYAREHFSQAPTSLVFSSGSDLVLQPKSAGALFYPEIDIVLHAQEGIYPVGHVTIDTAGADGQAGHSYQPGDKAGKGQGFSGHKQPDEEAYGKAGLAGKAGRAGEHGAPGGNGAQGHHAGHILLVAERYDEQCGRLSLTAQGGRGGQAGRGQDSGDGGDGGRGGKGGPGRGQSSQLVADRVRYQRDNRRYRKTIYAGYVDIEPGRGGKKGVRGIPGLPGLPGLRGPGGNAGTITIAIPGIDETTRQRLSAGAKNGEAGAQNTRGTRGEFGRPGQPGEDSTLKTGEQSPVFHQNKYWKLAENKTIRDQIVYNWFKYAWVNPVTGKTVCSEKEAAISHANRKIMGMGCDLELTDPAPKASTWAKFFCPDPRYSVECAYWEPCNNPDVFGADNRNDNDNYAKHNREDEDPNAPVYRDERADRADEIAPSARPARIQINVQIAQEQFVEKQHIHNIFQENVAQLQRLQGEVTEEFECNAQARALLEQVLVGDFSKGLNQERGQEQMPLSGAQDVGDVDTQYYQQLRPEQRAQALNHAYYLLAQMGRNGAENNTGRYTENNPENAAENNKNNDMENTFNIIRQLGNYHDVNAWCGAARHQGFTPKEIAEKRDIAYAAIRARDAKIGFMDRVQQANLAAQPTRSLALEAILPIQITGDIDDIAEFYDAFETVVEQDYQPEAQRCLPLKDHHLGVAGAYTTIVSDHLVNCFFPKTEDGKSARVQFIRDIEKALLKLHALFVHARKLTGQEAYTQVVNDVLPHLLALADDQHGCERELLLLCQAIAAVKPQLTPQTRLYDLVCIIKNYCHHMVTLPHEPEDLKRFRALPLGAWDHLLALDHMALNVLKYGMCQGPDDPVWLPLVYGLLDIADQYPGKPYLRAIAQLLQNKTLFPASAPQRKIDFFRHVNTLDLNRVFKKTAGGGQNIAHKVLFAQQPDWAKHIRNVLYHDAPEHVLNLDEILAEMKIDGHELTVHREKRIRRDLQGISQEMTKLGEQPPDPAVCRAAIQNKQYATLAAQLCHAMQLTTGHSPYLTQQIALLCFLYAWDETPDSGDVQQHMPGLLGQIGTGEGKSYITQMVVAANVLRGRNVNVVTSTPALANRDAQAAALYLRLFDIHCGCLCASNAIDDAQRKKQYAENAVLWGCASDFEQDRLMTEARGAVITLQRPHQKTALFIDEVDSMLLDNGSFVLYLSDELADLNLLEPLIYEIWSCVSWARLTLAEQASGADDLVSNDDVELAAYGQLKRQFQQASFGLTEKLKKWVDANLVRWIDSAIQAQNMQENREYIIEQDGDYAKVVVMDVPSGVEQGGMQWNDLLHQFLQLKHGFNTSAPTTMSIYESNLSFVNSFKGEVYGVTGTLGGRHSQQMICDLANAGTFILPRHKVSRLETLPVKIIDETESMEMYLVQATRDRMQQQAVLHVCESVQEANLLAAALAANDIVVTHTFVSNQDMEANSDKLQDVPKGAVFVATNIAGRGTDIQLSAEAAEKGLHIFCNYLANNDRMAHQIMGRAGRKGQKGSVQVVVPIAGVGALPAALLKFWRNVESTFSLEDIRDIDVPRNAFMQYLYAEYLAIKQACQQRVNALPEALQKAITNEITARWSFFVSQCTHTYADGDFESIEPNHHKVVAARAALLKDGEEVYDVETTLLMHATMTQKKKLLNLAQTLANTRCTQATDSMAFESEIVRVAHHYLETNATDIAQRLFADIAARPTMYAAYAAYYEGIAHLHHSARKNHQRSAREYVKARVKDSIRLLNGVINRMAEQQAQLSFINAQMDFRSDFFEDDAKGNPQAVNIARQTDRKRAALIETVMRAEQLVGADFLPEDIHPATSDEQEVSNIIDVLTQQGFLKKPTVSKHLRLDKNQHKLEMVSPGSQRRRSVLWPQFTILDNTVLPNTERLFALLDAKRGQGIDKTDLASLLDAEDLKNISEQADLSSEGETRLSQRQLINTLWSRLTQAGVIGGYEVNFSDFTALSQKFSENTLTGQASELKDMLQDVLGAKLGQFQTLHDVDWDIKSDMCRELQTLRDNDEIIALIQLGLRAIYTVEKSPDPPWAAMGATLIGIAQVAVGALIMSALSATGVGAGLGAAMGRFLISEGMNDVTMGVTGMIAGQFTWDDYAKSKLDSVVTTGVILGVGAAAKGLKQGYKAAKQTKNIKLVGPATKRGQYTRVRHKPTDVKGMRPGDKARQLGKYVVKKVGEAGLEGLMSAFTQWVMGEVMRKLTGALRASAEHKANKSEALHAPALTQLRQVFGQLYDACVDPGAANAALNAVFEQGQQLLATQSEFMTDSLFAKAKEHGPGSLTDIAKMIEQGGDDRDKTAVSKRERKMKQLLKAVNAIQKMGYAVDFADSVAHTQKRLLALYTGRALSIAQRQGCNQVPQGRAAFIQRAETLYREQMLKGVVSAFEQYVIVPILKQMLSGVLSRQAKRLNGRVEAARRRNRVNKLARGSEQFGHAEVGTILNDRERYAHRIGVAHLAILRQDDNTKPIVVNERYRAAVASSLSMEEAVVGIIVKDRHAEPALSVKNARGDFRWEKIALAATAKNACIPQTLFFQKKYNRALVKGMRHGEALVYATEKANDPLKVAKFRATLLADLKDDKHYHEAFDNRDFRRFQVDIQCGARVEPTASKKRKRADGGLVMIPKTKGRALSAFSQPTKKTISLNNPKRARQNKSYGVLKGYSRNHILASDTINKLMRSMFRTASTDAGAVSRLIGCCEQEIRTMSAHQHNTYYRRVASWLTAAKRKMVDGEIVLSEGEIQEGQQKLMDLMFDNPDNLFLGHSSENSRYGSIFHAAQEKLSKHWRKGGEMTPVVRKTSQERFIATALDFPKEADLKLKKSVVKKFILAWGTTFDKYIPADYLKLAGVQAADLPHLWERIDKLDRLAGVVVETIDFSSTDRDIQVI